MRSILNICSSLWRYRGFIAAITSRELRGRYTGSLLGPLWLLLQPLMLVAVYTVVFSQLLQARLPQHSSPFAYSIYLCAGLLPWGFLVEIVQRSKGLFIEHANLIKKSSFPRLILFAPVLLVAGFNFAVIFAIYLVFLIAIGAFPGIVLLGAVPLVAILALLGCTVGLALAVVNVFFRDIDQMVDIVLQLLFWGTPIVYSATILPKSLQALEVWNPVYAPIVEMQGLFLSQRWPDFGTLVFPALLVLVTLVLALAIYRRMYPALLDEL